MVDNETVESETIIDVKHLVPKSDAKKQENEC
jgi:hypothetical protein